jgi:hypothetical protein
MSGRIDKLDPRAGNPPGKLLGIGRRNDAVRLAPDDQRRRRNAVRVLVEAAIGDRPDELA